jgi:NAD(P)H-dependent FMN reductase
MNKPKIGIIIGSTRPGRFADQPAEWIHDIAKARGDIAVEVIDLRDYPLPFYDETGLPAMGPLDNEVAQRWQEKLASLDGFIFLVAEYNYGPTAVLKNAIDYAFHEWARKPVAFVGYGGVGGARAVEHLRLHAVALQMAPMRVATHISRPELMAIRNEGKKLSEFASLNAAAGDMLDQLVWWTKALSAAREADARAAEVKAA